MPSPRAFAALLAASSLLPPSPAAIAQEPERAVNPAPNRRAGEGEGPFERLIIRGATVIDGTGAAPQGPIDIVIEGNRIAKVRSLGSLLVPIDDRRRPKNATRELDAKGTYVLPGFINLHVHTGGIPRAPDAEYVYKLWIAHGITTVRGVPAGPVDWSLSERARSARNEIVAPRMFVYSHPRPGSGWRGPIDTPAAARAWVQWAADKGVDGVKVVAYDPEIMAAFLEEAKRLGLGSTAHLMQSGVSRMNLRDAARLGLRSSEHYYGLFEALLKDYSVQPWSSDHNFNNTNRLQKQVPLLWNKIHARGSDQWNALIEELLERRFILDPTFAIYRGGRDAMAARTSEWHEKYTLPSLWTEFQPSREVLTSYLFDWTTHDEIAWRNFYQVWMQFVNDYKNAGGRVTTGADEGFVYMLYGFGYIEELEFLQEAGFHPLEVIRSATLHSAEALYEPKGKPIELGIIRPGLLADLVIVDRSPLENLKVLYGTGSLTLNNQTGKVQRVGGVMYTIKDGIVYEARKLLADVARMVEEAKRSSKQSLR